ncbi:MAG: hypothetical protein J0M24_18975 [Verrucomicrobia bacterium]|nr:hypothetical protein [Verrucomicrobiota bacterium]
MRHWLQKAWNSPSLTTWTSLALRAGGAVITIPILLSSLSPVEVAVWYLLVTLLNIAQLLDFGFAPTITRATAYAIAGKRLNLENEYQTQQSSASKAPTETLLGALVVSARQIYVRIALVALGVATVLGLILLQAPIAKLPAPYHGYIALAVSLAAVPVLIANSGLVALLQGVGHVALIRRWDSGFLLASIASTFIVLKLGGSLQLLAISTQFWNAISLIRSILIFRKWFPEHHRFTNVDPVVLDCRARIWPAAWKYGLGIVLYSGSLQASGLIYAQFGTPVGVASYMVAMQILNLLKTTSQAPFQSRIPILATQYAQNNIQGMLTLARKAAVQSYWAFTLPFIFIAIAAPSILQSIGSKTPFVGSTMWGLMGAGALIERLGGTHQQLLSLSNKISAHIAGIGFAVVYTILLVVLSKNLNVYAFPLAIIGGHLAFFTPYSLLKSRDQFPLEGKSFDWNTFGPCIITMLCSLTLIALVNHYSYLLK